MKAAVMRAYKTPLSIEDVELASPGPHEVLVRTRACGVCHSDLHVLEGALPVPPPCVLGHEPAGVVEAVGKEVTYLRPGDPVIACLSVFCGTCNYCLSGRTNLCGGAATARKPGEPPRITGRDGGAIAQFAHVSGFAEQMLLHENALVKIRPDMPLEQAALIGCGVTTGVGAALNTARIAPGSSVAVIGCGGVGLSALQGARIAGAGRIIAVDTVPWKLELARKLGASDVVNASEGDAAAAVRELTSGGVETAFECIGTVPTCQQAVAMLCRGGTAVMVGVVPIGVAVGIQMLDVVLSGKKIVGSMMGDNRFRIDMPRYCDFYLDGRLRLDEMISARIPLDEVNEAFEKMKAGTVARSVIVFD
jgi:S-(hydroxymethyl)glutathione dehydrogenase/alcohol dehydrogenase